MKRKYTFQWPKKITNIKFLYKGEMRIIENKRSKSDWINNKNNINLSAKDQLL